MKTEEALFWKEAKFSGADYTITLAPRVVRYLTVETFLSEDVERLSGVLRRDSGEDSGGTA